MKPTLEEVVTLITRKDITPSFELVVRRGHEGSPVNDFALGDIRDALTALRKYIDRAEKLMNTPVVPAPRKIPVEAPVRKSQEIVLEELAYSKSWGPQPKGMSRVSAQTVSMRNI